MSDVCKRALAIHDISCVGRCSLTVALPIVSAAGIECSVIPTAVLSTHTGGFSGYTFRDLTEDMLPIAKHWKTLSLKYNAIYTGYLGSKQQIDTVAAIFDMFKEKDTLLLVDPVMADNGQFYSLFDKEFARNMATLCKRADVLIPNITEACFLLDKEYKPGIQTPEYIEDILNSLIALGTKKVVLTGVTFEENRLGAASLEAGGKIQYHFENRVHGYYHGTGDVFGSALLCALMHGFSLADAASIAVKYTCACIKRTYSEQTDVRYGVHFESEIPLLLKLLQK